MRALNCEGKGQEKFCAVSTFIELHTSFYQISNLEEFAIERRRNYLVKIPPSREYIFQRHFPGNDRELLIHVKYYLFFSKTHHKNPARSLSQKYDF